MASDFKAVWLYRADLKIQPSSRTPSTAVSFSLPRIGFLLVVILVFTSGICETREDHAAPDSAEWGLSPEGAEGDPQQWLPTVRFQPTAISMPHSYDVGSLRSSSGASILCLSPPPMTTTFKFLGKWSIINTKCLNASILLIIAPLKS